MWRSAPTDRESSAPRRTRPFEYGGSKRASVLHTLVGHTGTVYGLACSSDGKSLLTGSADGTLRLWDTDTGQEAQVWQTAKAEKRGITRLAWTPDRTIALAVTSEKTIEVWDMATVGKILRTLRGHADQVTRVVLIPD